MQTALDTPNTPINPLSEPAPANLLVLALIAAISGALVGLVGAAFCLMLIAIARPTGGTTEEVVTGMGMDIVIALDVSESMRAPDIERCQGLFLNLTWRYLLLFEYFYALN